MVAYIYPSEQHLSWICWYAHSITPDIAMARKLQLCQKIRCGRLDQHRTRRLDADGRPDCLGNHGQCGMALRGLVKRQAEEKSNRKFRVAKRLRSKLPPDRVTYAFRDANIQRDANSPRPIARVSDPYQAHGSVCACGEPPERSRLRRTSASDSSSARQVQFSSSFSTSSILLPGCPEA